MKKRKLTLLLPFSALVLGGCTFQEGWQTATGWLNDNIWQPVSGFVQDIFNPGGKEEKDEDEKATLKSLSVSGDYKQTYSIGEEFDSTGIIVTASYSDGSTQDVSSLASFSGFSSEEVGPVTVTVSYEGKTAEISLTIDDGLVHVSFESEVQAFAQSGITVQIPDYLSVEGECTLVSGEYRISKSTTAEMTAFAQSMAAVGWNLKTNNYGDYFGTFGATPAYVAIEDWLDYSKAAIVISFKTLEASWPSDYIEEAFDYYEAAAYYDDVPAFVGQGAAFDVSIYSESGFTADGVLITIYNATASEVSTYLQTTLPAAGWEVSGSAATQTFQSLNGVATIAFAGGEGFMQIALYFGLNPIPTAGFPSAAIADAFTQLGVTAFTIPEPDGEGYTFEYAFDEYNINLVDTYPEYCYDFLYINNMSSNQFDAYVLKIKNAGWTDSESSGTHVFTKQFEDKIAKLQLSHFVSDEYGEYAQLIIYYVMDDAPLTAWPSDKISAAFTTTGKPEFAVPALTGENLVFEVYEGYISSYGVYQVYVTGDNMSDLLDGYAQSIAQIGWFVTGGDSDYSAKLTTETGVANIEFYLSSSSGRGVFNIYLQQDALPTAEWPTNDIAALLPGASKDSVPAFSGDANSFTVLNDVLGTGVMVSVESGTEEAAISTYLSDLQTAGYTLNEAWGLYISQNGEIAIKAPTSSEAGSITISFEANPLCSTFPTELVNSFLSTYGLGFQLTAALPDDSGSGMKVEAIQDGDYHGLQVAFVGDQVDALYTALSTQVPSNYVWYSNYEMWYDASTGHQISLSVFGSYTYLIFWE